MSCSIRCACFAVVLSFAIATCTFAAPCFADDGGPQVTLNTRNVGPRAMEAQTETVLLRDYKYAWASIEQALESNSTAPLKGLFEGTADAWLTSSVNTQRQSGLTSRYLNQSHKVKAVFYSPEGDMIELHDTADYDLQILDGGKTIHDEHTVVHYVVLMTPGADRWVVRQIQAVPQF